MNTQSNHAGIGHWRNQRLSSIVLVPLTLWLLWAVTQLAGADYATALEFFSSTVQKVFAIAFIAVVAYHAQMGIQVVCEDYVYPLWLQAALIWLTRIAVTAGLALTIYALFNLPAGV